MQSTGSKISLEQDLIKNQIAPIVTNKKAHLNFIESLAVQPSGKIFATGSHDRTIMLWDVGTFKETMTLSDHKQGVWSLDYSKDGNLLVSGSPDKSVLIWDSKKSSPGTKINAHKGKVYATIFNQSSKLLATCGETGEIFIWDLAKTKQPFKKMQVDSLIAYDIEWSNNQQLFFVTTLGSQLLAYDSKTFTQVSQHLVTENVHDSKCESIAANFKLIDRRVFCGTHRGHIAWYEMKDNMLVKEAEFLAHLDSVRTINYDPSRKILLSTGRDGSAKLWNVESNTHHPSILENLVQHLENIPGAGFINGQLVVTVMGPATLLMERQRHLKMIKQSQLLIITAPTWSRASAVPACQSSQTLSTPQQALDSQILPPGSTGR